MNKLLIALAIASVASLAQAQETKVAIAISGWTGFAPLTLAKEAGLFKKQGLDVTIKKIPQKDRHLAIASGDVQCAATTVETWILGHLKGVTDPEAKRKIIGREFVEVFQAEAKKLVNAKCWLKERSTPT